MYILYQKLLGCVLKTTIGVIIGYIMIALVIVSILIMLVFMSMLISMRPIDSQFSTFELNRRREMGDRQARIDIQRQKYNDAVTRLKLGVIIIIYLLIISIIISLVSGPLGFLLSLAVILVSLLLAKTQIVTDLAMKIYTKNEKKLFSVLRKPIVRLFYAKNQPNNQLLLGSIDELQHIVEQSDGMFNDDEKTLVKNALKFSHKKVSQIMVKKTDIKTINKSDFLGPLVLDDLYKAGFDRLPVIDNDIDHIVGILNIKSLLNLNNKRSTTAEKSMEKEICFVKEHDSLVDVLAVFLDSRNDLMIVINDNRQTVGLITIEDIIEALFGRRISMNFDDHSNIHAVAKR